MKKILLLVLFFFQLVPNYQEGSFGWGCLQSAFAQGENLGGETPPRDLPSVEVCTVICNDVVEPNKIDYDDCYIYTWTERQLRVKDVESCHCVDDGAPIKENELQTINDALDQPYVVTEPQMIGNTMCKVTLLRHTLPCLEDEVLSTDGCVSEEVPSVETMEGVGKSSGTVEWLVKSLPSTTYLLTLHQPSVWARALYSFVKNTNSSKWKFEEAKFVDCDIPDNGYAGPVGTCEWYFSQPPIGTVNENSDQKNLTIKVSGGVKEREIKDAGVILNSTTHLILLGYTYKEVYFKEEKRFTIDINIGKLY